ncbi:MAG TPA: HDOD domain-containing protein [Spirochaetota bacterium]|nr:HDOD domain-containing protein [Spirochaetota bacterium]HOS39803.1 HDOD domain-containing protein [Spirochaetota bacterium]
MVTTVNGGEPVEFNFYYPHGEIMQSINSLLAKLLANFDQIFLLDTVTTILREIIINATKANAKRVYFKKINLDITKPNEYTEGIQNFKNNVIGNLEELAEDMKKSDLKVSMNINKENGGFKITVTNDVPILPEELERINLRKAKAIEYNDFTDAYDEIYDSTEGAGLGIVLIMLLLKNSGINTSSYVLNSDGKKTWSWIVIPGQTRPNEITTEIKKQIINEVNGLPTFPKNIIELQAMCKDSTVDIDDIAKKIMLDPALTTDVLKLSNSAGFLTQRRIDNVNEALIKIGLKNLNSILVAASARRILDKRFSKFEQIWTHCNKTAFYARNIAQRYKMGAILEHSFLAGLLHDLGKIVLLSTDTKITNWISDIVKDRKMRVSTVMEEVSIGISHSSIGELIARKWQFPEYLIEAIKYHHSPLSASEEYRDLVYTTYLANMMCGIESRKYGYYYLDEDVLERFKINGPEAFGKFHEEFKTMLANNTAKEQ